MIFFIRWEWAQGPVASLQKWCRGREISPLGMTLSQKKLPLSQGQCGDGETAQEDRAAFGGHLSLWEQETRRALFTGAEHKPEERSN